MINVLTNWRLARQINRHRRWVCTHCGLDKVDATIYGCGDPDPTGQRTACPMDLKSPIRRFLLWKLGWRWVI